MEAVHYEAHYRRIQLILQQISIKVRQHQPNREEVSASKVYVLQHASLNRNDLYDRSPSFCIYLTCRDRAGLRLLRCPCCRLCSGTGCCARPGSPWRLPLGTGRSLSISFRYCTCFSVKEKSQLVKQASFKSSRLQTNIARTEDHGDWWPLIFFPLPFTSSVVL